MALIAIASDKGAPGVTTAALALAAVWPRPVLLAECDPAGGDLAYRFPAATGGQLDPRRGVLSLAVTARRGMQPNQVWEHVQKLNGGLDVLLGVTNAEQGAGLNLLWGQIGRALAGLPQADVIADCGRLGADGPAYDLLAEAAAVVLVSRASVGDVIRLRDRAAVLAAAAESRNRRGFVTGVLIVADSRSYASVAGEIQQVLRQANVPATVLGALADDPKAAGAFRGGQVGKLDKTPLIKSAVNIVQQLVGGLPAAPPGPPSPGPQVPVPPTSSAPQPVGPQPTGPQPVAPAASQASAPPIPGAPNAAPAPGVLVASRQGRHHSPQSTGPQAQQQPLAQQQPQTQPQPQQPPAQQPPAQQPQTQQQVPWSGTARHAQSGGG
jgi:MinD-like ATPase involved in chromosome partitioning or flagellar assembly